MLSSFKRLFGKQAANRAGSTAVLEPPPAPPPMPSRGAQPAENRLQANGSDSNNVCLPIRLVISRLQPALRSRVRITDVQNVDISIPTEKILPQLARGAVKISFGELRQISPPGAFAPEADLDQTPVGLPLPEILAQINPAHLTRRQNQKKINISDEVAGPFGPETEGLAFSVSAKNLAGKNGSSPAPTVLPPSEPAPLETTIIQKPEPKPEPFATPAIFDAPSPSPTEIIRMTKAAAEKAMPGVPPTTAVSPIAAPALPIPIAMAAVAPPPAAVPVSVVAPVAEPPAPVAIPAAELVPAPAPAPIVPTPAPAPMPRVATVEKPYLTIPLAELAEAWPDTVCRDLFQMRLTNSNIHLPMEVAEVGMRQGKLNFPWRLVRAWLNPQAPHSAASAHDQVMLDLPLGLVAPLYMARQTGETPAALAEPPAPKIPTAIPATPVAVEARKPVAVEPAKPVAPVQNGGAVPHAGTPYWNPSPFAASTAATPVAPPLPPIGVVKSEPAVAAPQLRLVEPPKPTPALALAPSGEVLTVPIAELCAAWPEQVRKVIVQLGLAGAKMNIPVETIGVSLKQGKASFAWSVLSHWITPAPKTDLSGVLSEDKVLDLPLHVVAPLFLARQKPARSQKTISIDANIPDLFSNSGKSPSAAESPAPAPRPMASPTMAAALAAPLAGPANSAAKAVPDTNYYVWKDGQPAPEEVESVVFKKGPSPGTKFLNRYATPNEIVSKAAGLEGVDGALIALPDGLLVASRIAPGMNGDVLAAFLPQIHGRVSQSTRELRMGELNNLSFTVGNVPWKIFKVGAIFFAAFGVAGLPLPGNALAGIAAELDRNPNQTN